MLSEILNLSIRRLPSGRRYYYSRLTYIQKSIYRLLTFGMFDLSSKITLPYRPVNEVLKIFEYVLYDNPMIFYTNSFKQTNDLFRFKSVVEPKYEYSKGLVREYRDRVERLVDECARLEQTEFEKVRFVHDFCLERFKYDFEFSKESYTVLGLVLNNTAVCEGISKFAKLVFDRIGIKSLVVFGQAKNPINAGKFENHVWNIVKVEGNYYHLDITFDMTLMDKCKRYDYFLLNDKEIQKDHIIIEKVPVCTVSKGDRR